MIEAVEVKVRLLGDFRNWEDIEVNFRTIEYNNILDLRKLLEKLKSWCQTEFVSEIRWNYLGSPQGHYFINQNSSPTLISIFDDLRDQKMETLRCWVFFSKRNGKTVGYAFGYTKEDAFKTMCHITGFPIWKHNQVKSAYL